MLAGAWLLPLLVAPFIGSFLGLLVARLPAGQDVVWGRSACDACRHALHPFELIPIASWLALRGKCRHCGESVTPLYPTIELAALGIAIWAVLITKGWILWASCALGWLLLALAVIDARTGLLPDILTLPLLSLGLAAAAFGDVSQFPRHLLGAIAGFASFGAISWVYRRWRGRAGLGFGDVKLLAAGGAWVAWQGLPSVVFIAAFSSLAAALFIGLGGKGLTLEQKLSFGPGLCLGIWLVWLYGPLR